MTIDEAISLVGRWPQDRTVPRKLSDAVAAARGEDRMKLGMMFEALAAASETEADILLVRKYAS